MLPALMRALLLVPVLALLTTACAEPGHRSAGGVLITSDGRFIPNTDVNARAETERAIVASIGEHLGAGWTVEAALAELPDLDGDRIHGSPEWRWAAIHARVTLRGDGVPPVPPEEVQAAVARYLGRKLADRAPGPVVVEVVVTPPVAVAAPVAAPASTPSAEAPRPTGRTYTVQPGDTWADVSTAFYGSAEGWRSLRDANGGADRPAAGQVVVIPPR